MKLGMGLGLGIRLGLQQLSGFSMLPLVSAVVSKSGSNQLLTLNFNAPATVSNSTGLTLVDSTQSLTLTLTYSSGTATTALVFTITGGTIVSGDGLKLSYNQSTGNIVVDLASFTNIGVTNNVGVVAPTNTVAPVVSGSLTEGGTLSTTNGTWTGSPTGYTYQWHNSSTGNISGATSSTYVTQSTDLTDNIYCIVTATNAAGSTNANSNTVGPIVPPVPVNSVAPVVSGSLTQGSTLTTTNGTWTNSPTSYHYQWYNSSTGAISGATSSTYATQASDVGDDIYCAVTAINAGGDSTPADSNSVGPITASSYTPSLNFSIARNSMYAGVI
jgi:hypothetical protein